MVDVLEAAVCPQPEMVIELVTAEPASGIETSVPLVPVQEELVDVAVAVAVAVVVVVVVVAVAVELLPSTTSTVTVLLVQEAAYEVSAVFSAVSTVRPHRVLSATQSVMY